MIIFSEEWRFFSERARPSDFARVIREEGTSCQ
jgi:hypothetical protein